jgi:chromosome segregation ATPase
MRAPARALRAPGGRLRDHEGCPRARASHEALTRDLDAVGSRLEKLPAENRDLREWLEGLDERLSALPVESDLQQMKQELHRHRRQSEQADAQIERDRVAGGGEATGRRRGKGQTGRLLRVGEKGSEHKKAALPA